MDYLLIGNTAAGRDGGVAYSNFAAINCTFDGNNATGGGGVIQSYNGQATFLDCSFRYNYGMYGGVSDMEHSTSVIEHCLFSKNVATVWGGVANFYKSSSFITDSEFVNNTIVNCGGVLHNSRENITVQSCNFSYNKALNNG